jgi:hypothetical protein
MPVKTLVQSWFNAEFGGSLFLPDGWYRRPYDNQHMLTVIDESGDALSMTWGNRLTLRFNGPDAVTQLHENGVTISPLGSIGMHLLSPGRAEEYVPVLPLTTSRCVSCGAKIAPVTVLVRAASAALAACQTLIGHRGCRPGAHHASHRVAGLKPT